MVISWWTIEINESAEDALHREIYEELGIGINIVYKFQCLNHTYDDGIFIAMIQFICELIFGQEKPYFGRMGSQRRNHL